ncbi:MAG: FadR family transcriptional regulator [Deltaproteobacteria bacterium]|nr:FadR family transcriptional regulator [Deltaproteobacteria bacterium]
MIPDTSSKIIFTPIKNKRTFEEISLEIKRLIFKGILKPNDKLPSEIELARQFNVGRQTLREALRLLELSGFIAIQKGSTGGPIIEDTIFNTISNSFLDAFLMKKITTEELTIARLETEKGMLKYVIDNAKDSDIRSLKENIVQAKKHAKANIRPFRDNIEFHRLLAKASKNQMFVIMVESIMAIVADFFSRLEPEFDVSKRVIEKHEALLNAIIRRDRDKAMSLLEDHILKVGKRFQKIIDEVRK